METIFPMADEFGTFLADGSLGNEFRFKRIEPIWDSFDRIEFQQGMDVTFVTTAQTDEQAYMLLKELGMPFIDRSQKA